MPPGSRGILDDRCYERVSSIKIMRGDARTYFLFSLSPCSGRLFIDQSDQARSVASSRDCRPRAATPNVLLSVAWCRKAVVRAIVLFTFVMLWLCDYADDIQLPSHGQSPVAGECTKSVGPQSSGLLGLLLLVLTVVAPHCAHPIAVTCVSCGDHGAATDSTYVALGTWLHRICLVGGVP